MNLFAKIPYEMRKFFIPRILSYTQRLPARISEAQMTWRMEIAGIGGGICRVITQNKLNVAKQIFHPEENENRYQVINQEVELKNCINCTLTFNTNGGNKVSVKLS